MIARYEDEKIKTYNDFPNTLIINGKSHVLNYKKATHRHYADGFRDVVKAIFNTETHKRGEVYFDEVNDYFSYHVIELTIQELDSRIPSQLSKIQFKTGLLINHGITNVVVQAFFNTLNEGIEKETLILGWNESTVFDRKDQNLRNFAPEIGISLEQLDQIFIDYYEI